MRSFMRMDRKSSDLWLFVRCRLTCTEPWQAAAKLAEALGLHDQAVLPRKRAERLREDFNRAFWCEEISSFALALDGQKRPCRVRASNAGHCLISGIATTDHARLVSQTLMAPRVLFRLGYSNCGRRRSPL